MNDDVRVTKVRPLKPSNALKRIRALARTGVELSDQMPLQAAAKSAAILFERIAQITSQALSSRNPWNRGGKS